MPDSATLEWSSLALSVVGTFLLFREVARGHRFERQSIELEALREKLAALQGIAQLGSGSDRDFYIAYRRYGSPHEPMETTEAFVAGLGDDAIRAAVAPFKQNLPAEVAAVMARLASAQRVFRTTYATAQLRQRSLLLWLGFLLLMLSAALHLMATLPPAHAPLA